MVHYAAYIYSFLLGIIFLFHIALIFGAPWGEITMGGQDAGKLPTKKRIYAFFALFLLGFYFINVLSQTELMFKSWKYITNKTIWIVVFLNALTLLGNFMTKSKRERNIWAPIALVMFVCILIISMA